jgi:AraC-like DNA-binding protein
MPHLIEWVREQTGDADAIRRLPGLLDLSDPDLRVPETTVESAWQAAATSSGSSAVGIELAQWLPRGALDLVEFAIRSSPSVAAGLERLARFGRVLSDRISAELEAAADGVRLVVAHRGASALHPGRTEFALAQALRLVRECAGHDIVPRSVSFAHEAPPDTSIHETFFRVPVRFAADSSCLALRPEDAARPFLTADDALAAIVRRRLEKALREREVPSPESLSAQVRRMLVDSLGQQTLNPDAAARVLALSRRTLSRRLAEEGASFRAILDDVRREFAQTLVRDQTISIADIAFFLQYSEPAAFHRSFRRWFGQTPRTFREAQVGNHPDQ